MNRRDVLKGMLTLPALSLLDGCRPRHQETSGTRLCVVLQGPFAVVMHKNKDYRVTAFVPKLSSDDRATHEFRFRNPNHPLEGCRAGYRFELLNDGLETGGQEPRVDRGFDNVRFSVDKWVPDWDNYFVSLELPTPDVISYIPPLYPALFESGYEFGDRLGSAPLNHVLEYRIRGENDIRLRPKQLQRCEAEPDKPPVPSKQLLEEFRAYEKQTWDPDPLHSERAYIEHWFARYSFIYFLGVGVAPPAKRPENPDEFMRNSGDHGVRFFNERLLPAIYQDQPIPPGSRLKKIGKDVLQCDPQQSESPALEITPGVWRPSMQRPRILNVASTENCTSPGATGTAGHG